MLVLGIESTCDETGCAIVHSGRDVLANLVASQVDLHEEFGGVVPELACRRHIEALIPLLDQTLEAGGVSLDEIDLIAAAHGPGLIGALLIGLNAAKALAFSLNKPLVCINHVEAHLYAALMSSSQEIPFPCLGAVLSGGHTAIILVEAIGSYQLIGQTADDAVGEAFDKAAKILGLPYPGGPQIERLAESGDPQSFALKAGKLKGRPFDFSFSGLKTALLYAARGPKGKGELNPCIDPADLAASFQRAAFSDIISKIGLAGKHFGISHVIFGGGVTNNQTLREMFKKKYPALSCIWPGKGLSLDNAAMIAGLGYHRYRSQGEGDPLSMLPLIRIPFG